MEPRGNSAGGKYAAAPPVRTSEPARAVWWLLAGKDDEDSTSQISMLTFTKFQRSMKMKKLFLVLVIGLAGCSVNSLESQKPILSEHTSKSADQVNRCLAPKWVELRSSSSSIPTESGYKITASDDIFGALSVVNIDESEAGGSDVKVYAVAKGWNDHWATAARSCL